MRFSALPLALLLACARAEQQPAVELVSMDPYDGQGDVLIGKRFLEMNFSAPVKAGFGDVVVKFMFDEAEVERIPVTDASRIAISNGGTTIRVSIDAQTFRRELGNYFVEIDSGAFTNATMAAASYPGTGPKTTWNFRCAIDSLPPIVLFSDPAINQVGWPMRSVLISLKMDEHIVTGRADGYIRLSRASGLGGVGEGMLLEDISVHDTDKVSMHEDVVNITILEGSTSMYESFTYRIDVSAGAFKDVAETPNQFEGLTYTFQTGYDTRPPVVFSTTPMPNGDIPVQSTTLVISFDKLVEKGSGLISVYKNSTNELRQSVSVQDATVFVFYTTVLVTISSNAVNEEATSYYVLIDGGTFRDKSSQSNLFAGDVGYATFGTHGKVTDDPTVWSFTTRADLTEPTVKETTPRHLSTGVPPSSQVVTIILSEKVRAEDVPTAGTIQVQTANTDCDIGCGILETIMANDTSRVIVEDSLVGATITIKVHPFSIRTEHTWHSILISNNAFIDFGTAHPNFFLGTMGGQWMFETGTDTAAPLILQTVPVADNTNVDVHVPFLEFEFDEKIVPMSGSSGDAIFLERRDNIGANGDWVVQESWPTDSDRLDFSQGNVLRVAVAQLDTTADRDVPPDTNLRRNSQYRIVIAASSVRDTAATPNTFGGTSFEFHTRFDVSPPVLLNTVPAAGEVGVALQVNGIRKLSTASIALEFAETVIAHQGTIRIYELDATCDQNDPIGCCGHAEGRSAQSEGANCICSGGFEGASCETANGDPDPRETINVADTSVVSFDVNMVTITLDPQTLKKEHQTYYVQIDPTAFIDTATYPNLFAGITDRSYWFTMAADITPPHIETVFPTVGSTIFFGHTLFEVELDEPVRTVPGVMQVKQTKNPFTAFPVDSSSSEVVSVQSMGDSWRTARSKVVFTIPSTFLRMENRDYAVQIDATCMQDLANAPNFFPGIFDDTTWNFRVQPNANLNVGRGASINLGPQGEIKFRTMENPNSGFMSNEEL